MPRVGGSTWQSSWRSSLTPAASSNAESSARRPCGCISSVVGLIDALLRLLPPGRAGERPATRRSLLVMVGHNDSLSELPGSPDG